MLAPLCLLLEYLASSYAFQQLAPLLVLFGIPAFALFARAHRHALLALARMLLDAFGLSVSWFWGSGGEGSHVSAERRRKRKKSALRSRAELFEMNGTALHADKHDDDDDDLYYPGLVNVSGTYCFLNSVLQAMASLAYLHPHIEAVHTKAVELDVPTPVVDTLQDTLRALNTPKFSPSSFRPVPVINALSQPSPGWRPKLFSSREHQDAQELFQLLSECIKAEALAVDREGLRDRGLGAYALGRMQEGAELGAGVFDGLTANRRSCVQCGYTEAVMHFSFDNWQLSLPRMAMACALQDCLADYIRLELLTDCICRKCSMLATHERLRQEADRLKEAVSRDASASQSKKKRAREARKLEVKVKAAIDEGRIEEDIKGVKMEKVFSKASTKQAMIARPPKILVLHLNRSVHYGNYARRNSCRVFFPEILDLTPYTTSGQLSTSPSVPISTPPPPIPRSTTPTQSIYATPRVLYRLSAVVCHYGAHSFGHYVCFRRKPHVARDRTAPATLAPPQMACPYGCECTECTAQGPVRDNDGRSQVPGRGWLRISDDAVEECGPERVLAEGVGAFLLFYERVASPRPAVYLARSPRSSEETVRPAEAAGSVDTLSASMSGAGSESASASMGMSMSMSMGMSASGSLLEKDAERALLRPRVVRRTTAAGRSRSASAVSSDRAASEALPAPPPLPTAAHDQERASGGSSSFSSSASETEIEHPVVLNGHAVLAFASERESEEYDLSASLSESVVKIDAPVPKPNSTSNSASTSTSKSAPGSTSLSESDTASELSASASAGANGREDRTHERVPPGTPARAPSPTPAAKAAQARIPAPQAVHAASLPAPASSVPERAPVGLRA